MKTITISIKKAAIIASALAALGLVGFLAFYFKGLFFAASVNGSLISRLVVIQELEKNSGKDILNVLITRKLIGDEARKRGVVISDQDVSAEIKNVEDQIASQGGTLEQALASQGMTREELKKQIIIQKELEKLLADKTSATDTENFSQEANDLVNSLRTQAKIRYFVNY